MKGTDVEGGAPEVAESGNWFDQVPAAAAILAPDGRVLRCNDEASELLGHAAPGGGSRPVPWFERLKSAIEGGSGSIVISRRSGSGRVAVEVRGRQDADGNVVVLLRDCSTYQQARRARTAGERRLRSFLDGMPEAFVIEQDGRIVHINPAAARLVGESPARLVGRPIERLLPPDVLERVAESLRTPGDHRPLDAVIGQGSAAANVHVSALPLQYRRRPAMQLLLRDVTAHMRAEAGLRATHERLRLITDVVRDHAILNVDVDRAVVSWNATAERLTGYTADEVVRRPVAVITADSECVAVYAFEQARVEGRHESEIGIRRQDGSVFRAHMTLAAQADPSGEILGYTMILRDLTERLQAEEDLRRSEEQLRHSQKMDAVGRLASGIAHDFNNVLTAIQGHVQFLLEDLPEDMPSRDDATEIRRAAERATQLTRQLLTFARRQPSEPVQVDVNNVITDVEKLLRRLIRADIDLQTDLMPVPEVFADPGQLEQVIVNLVVNARDAMAEGGTITIRTSAIEFDQAYTARGVSLRPGSYVQMSITDSGCGIPEDVQQRIFEPFFTTKDEGTGLGLSTVYGITKQSGGHVSVYSEPGVGTTFKVFLPVHGANDGDAAPVGTHQETRGPQAGSVLLVEDDDAVRTLARRILEGRGYAVIEAPDGEAALRSARAALGIDVVVTDLSMPSMSGEDLVERISLLNPEIGVVLMSGFPEAAVSRERRLTQRRYFLEKPFTPESLVVTVRRAMNGHAKD